VNRYESYGSLGGDRGGAVSGSFVEGRGRESEKKEIRGDWKRDYLFGYCIRMLEYALSLARDLAHSWPSWPPSILSVCNSSIKELELTTRNCHIQHVVSVSCY
jgi:hypothetical protein